MKMLHMKSFPSIFIIPLSAAMLLAGFQPEALAKIEWETIKTFTLEEKPLDVAYSLDGTKVFALFNKEILIYQTNTGEVEERVPISEKYSRISVSSRGDTLYLTDEKGKQISIVKITPIYEIEAGKSPIIGNKNAKVHVVAFLDYQCPYCAQIYPTLMQLIDKYPQDISFIIKHYPLKGMHKFAENAALAALAAAKQNKYKEISEVYFKNYKTLNDETIKSLAQEAGLDMQAFEKELQDQALKTIIQEDLQLGKKVGIRGVPAVYINGRAIKGRTIDALSRMVDEELKKK